MNRERLELLHYMLTEDMPSEVKYFYMTDWVRKKVDYHDYEAGGEDVRYLPVSLISDDANTCGTAACALGSATMYLPFRSAGLKFNEYWQEVSYQGHNGLSAGEVFFELTRRQAEYLFYPSSYPVKKKITPADVAARVMEILKGEY